MDQYFSILYYYNLAVVFHPFSFFLFLFWIAALTRLIALAHTQRHRAGHAGQQLGGVRGRRAGGVPTVDVAIRGPGGVVSAPQRDVRCPGTRGAHSTVLPHGAAARRHSGRADHGRRDSCRGRGGRGTPCSDRREERW